MFSKDRARNSEQISWIKATRHYKGVLLKSGNTRPSHGILIHVSLSNNTCFPFTNSSQFKKGPEL